MLNGVQTPGAPDPRSIEAAVEQIAGSSTFASAPRLAQFLRFICTETLSGRGSELKESVLAAEIFGREAGYDPKRDAIVRVTASKLRLKLLEFYHTDASAGLVRIELPRGAYTPIFLPPVEPLMTRAYPRGNLAGRWARPVSRFVIAGLVVACLLFFALMPARTPRTDQEAERLVERGRNAEDTDAARGYFEAALAQDSEYAPAHAGLAMLHITAAERARTEPRQLFDRAELAARRALELQAGNVEGHLAMAEVVSARDWKWTVAEQHFREAVRIDPSNELATRRFALYLSRIGRSDEGINQARRLLQSDPLSTPNRIVLTSAYYMARQYHEAVRTAQETIRLDPKTIAGRYWLGRALVRTGHTTEGAEAILTSARYSTDDRAAAGALAISWAALGRRIELRELTERLLVLRRTKWVSPYKLAQVQLALGQESEALRLLEEAAEVRDYSLVSLKVDDTFDSLRDSPRFKRILAHIGLP